MWPWKLCRWTLSSPTVCVWPWKLCRQTLSSPTPPAPPRPVCTCDLGTTPTCVYMWPWKVACVRVWLQPVCADDSGWEKSLKIVPVCTCDSKVCARMTPWPFVSPAGPPNSGDFETRSGRKKWSFETSREGTFGQAMMNKHEQQQQFSANFKLPFSSCQATATFLLSLNPTSCTDLKMGGYGILERLPGYFWESRCSTEGLTLGYLPLF